MVHIFTLILLLFTGMLFSADDECPNNLCFSVCVGVCGFLKKEKKRLLCVFILSTCLWQGVHQFSGRISLCTR